MKKLSVFIPFAGLILFFAFAFIAGQKRLILLFPLGTIAQQQAHLIFLAIAIMLIIIVPVYVALFFVAFKFRSGKKSEKSSYEQKIPKKIQLLWWVAPSLIILIIAFITWGKTHALDPYNELDSRAMPLRIQVVALQWKWLFLYPEENIATVNFVVFPERTPIAFELTSDGPMNSFWLPALSGQIYAMSGMSTKLHIKATSLGDFNGYAAEINGKGYSGMKFTARSVSKEDFGKWVNETKNNKMLDDDGYKKIATPSEDAPIMLYGSYERDLYDKILAKYQQPMAGMESK